MSIKKQTTEDKAMKACEAETKELSKVEGEKFHFPTLGVTVTAKNRKEAEEKAKKQAILEED